MNMEAQVDFACRAIKRDPLLADRNINLVGISQGGMVARGIVEQCNGVKGTDWNFIWYERHYLNYGEIKNVISFE